MPEELEEIILHAEKKLHIALPSSARHQLALRSRGTPRVALRLLKRIRDVAQIHNISTVSEDVLHESFGMLHIDTLGLHETDRKYLLLIIEKHAGGPIGIETLAAALSEDIGTIEELIEPYLLQTGLIKRTGRGRVTTDLAYQHLNKTK